MMKMILVPVIVNVCLRESKTVLCLWKKKDSVVPFFTYTPTQFSHKKNEIRRGEGEEQVVGFVRLYCV